MYVVIVVHIYISKVHNKIIQTICDICMPLFNPFTVAG